MAGRVWGHLPGGRYSTQSPFVLGEPNWNLFPLDVRATRRLYHSGLQLDCSYPAIPTRTKNFHYDILIQRQHAVQRTLTSTRVSLWPGYADDVIIHEIWDAPGGLSFHWRFFDCLYRMYHNEPDWQNGESLVWIPFDRTQKIYPVDIISLQVDGEDFDVDWAGFPTEASPRFWQAGASTCDPNNTQTNIMATKRLEIRLKLRPETPPGASVFLTEGSETDETGNFAPQ